MRCGNSLVINFRSYCQLSRSHICYTRDNVLLPYLSPQDTQAEMGRGRGGGGGARDSIGAECNNRGGGGNEAVGC